MTEDKMVRRHHRLDGHEFEQAPGVGDGQASLVCCSPKSWAHEELENYESVTGIICPLPLNPSPISHPIPPLWVVTEHWVELPVSHS